MSRWSEQLDQHAIWQTIDRIRAHLASEVDDTDGQKFVEKRRLLGVLEQYAEVLGALDGERVPFLRLDKFNNHLTSHVANNTEAYSTSGDLTQLQSANDQLTSQMLELGVLRSLSGDIAATSQVAGLNDLADKFATKIKAETERMSEELASLKTEMSAQYNSLSELSSKMDTKQQETDILLAQWQAKFNEQQQDWQNEAKTVQDRLERETETKFAELYDAKAGEIERTIVDAQSQTETLAKNTSTELDHIVDDSKEKHELILDLFELVAGDSVAAGYLQNARDESKQANLWRWISVACIGGAVIWLLGIFVYTQIVSSGGFSLVWYLPVFSLTGVLLGAAAYMAQQSTKHRANEKRDKWFYLQMKSIDPFIRSLDPAAQQELKKELTAKLFGNDRSDVEPNFVSEHALGALTKTITEIMRAAK